MSVGSPTPPCFLPPSPSSCRGGRPSRLARFGPALPKHAPLVADAVALGSGLRTPPVDDMSTAYHPAMPVYDGRPMHGYPASAMVHAGRSRAMADEAKNAHHYRCQPTQTAYAYQTRNASHLANQLPDPSSRRSTRPSTPSSDSTVTTKQDKDAAPQSSETLIYHSLQIPKCISPEGGNLSDFAAQVSGSGPSLC
ncbi:hypothetical protein CDD83_5061 [Cordyceps sp. RAO-2017]|nr:hypothetical protein CDD83_5061 [Cordyceps sp. RAO-2017]